MDWEKRAPCKVTARALPGIGKMGKLRLVQILHNRFLGLDFLPQRYNHPIPAIFMLPITDDQITDHQMGDALRNEIAGNLIDASLVQRYRVFPV